MDKGMSPPPPGFTTAPPVGSYGPPPSYNDGQPNVVIVGAQQFGPESQSMTCPHCRAQISTRVENESTSKTHLFALLLCVFGLWCCVPCPYCINSCMTQMHYCPACNAFLGKCDN
ncbi:lipopolysaccharide-induced tumor necrosis factor-alpha factor homolog [Halictus rubicundus]|uniref:lipopolysaccharide-induced tumor necrosis factor-alpha factor homolog n=1 Tax=Halictus rubicundus TaxID=77578 RepID=UPI0040370A3B